MPAAASRTRTGAGRRDLSAHQGNGARDQPGSGDPGRRRAASGWTDFCRRHARRVHETGQRHAGDQRGSGPARSNLSAPDIRAGDAHTYTVADTRTHRGNYPMVPVRLAAFWLVHASSITGSHVSAADGHTPTEDSAPDAKPHCNAGAACEIQRESARDRHVRRYRQQHHRAGRYLVLAVRRRERVKRQEPWPVRLRFLRDVHDQLDRNGTWWRGHVPEAGERPGTATGHTVAVADAHGAASDRTAVPTPRALDPVGFLARARQIVARAKVFVWHLSRVDRLIVAHRALRFGCGESAG